MKPIITEGKNHMADFTISLAGVPIRISSLHDTTRDFCSDYLCNAEPQLSIEISPADIARERIQSARQRERDGLPPRETSEQYLEILALLRRIANRIVDENVVLFHGSAVAVDGKAYLFTAPSGTGKTTHTRLWLEQLPQAHVLNGDKPFLRLDPNGTASACGTPWRGKERYGCNEILPLAAICLLKRSEENHIAPITSRDALDALMRQTHIPNDATAMLKAIQLIGKIGEGVRLYRLDCNMEPEAARVSIGAMIGGRP